MTLYPRMNAALQRREDMTHLIIKSTATILVISLPLFLGFAFFGRQILSVFWAASGAGRNDGWSAVAMGMA